MANLYDKAGLVNIPVGYQEGFLYNIKPEDNTLGFRFNRDSAATRVNKKGLIEQVGYFGPELVQNGNFSELGPELVTNGDFATDSDWTKGTGWSISGNAANASSAGSGQSLSQNSGILSGKIYKVVYTVSDYIEGGVYARIGNSGTGTIRQENGTFTEYITQSGNSTIYFTAYSGSTTLKIDNVSVKQVDPNNYWNLGTGWSFGDGLASCDGSQTGNSSLQQSSIAEVGKVYKIVFDLTVTSGQITYVNLGGWIDNTNLNSSGTYVYTTTTTTATDNFGIAADSNFIGTVENVSVVEILGDKPRIDYTDSLTSPSFLLEPQSTNLITFSEDFTQWSIAGSGTQISTVTNQKNPSGNNQSGFITFSSSVSTIKLVFIFTSSSSSVHSYSVFVKYHSKQWIQLNTSLTHANFDVKNGVLGNFNGCVPSIENYGNGWYKLSMVTNNAVNPITCILANIDDGTAGSPAASTSTGSYYVWGAQLEASSYPTSYIPTAGFTATRTQETCNGAGNVSTFNSTEGVLYAEIAALANDNTYRFISASSGAYANSVRIGYFTTSNVVEFRVVSGGVNQGSLLYTLPNATDIIKIAGRYKQNDFSLWVNGTKVVTDTSGNVPVGLSELAFDDGNTSNNSPFYGKTKGVYVFNEALTDDELQQLTGPEYNSFAALAAAYNYTVI